MLISQEYRKLNAQLHEERPDYGTSGHRWAPTVQMLAPPAPGTILDYGCGKRTLRNGLAKDIRERLSEYDPAIPGLEAAPQPADLVVCTDVLEHVEPELLSAVLDDLRRVTQRLAMLSIATRPAKKALPDGRNAHLIQEPARWWLPRLLERFDLRRLEVINPGEFFVLVEPRAC